MIRFLRRLSVRQRIFGGFAVLILLMASSLPLMAFNYQDLTAYLERRVNVDAQANRLLLSAAVRVASSRANLLRYLRDTVPSPYEALDDIDRALAALAQAQELLTDPQQRERIAQLRVGLNEYRELIDEIQLARGAGDAARVSSLEFESQRLGNDISVQIERVVELSQQQLAATNTALMSEAQQRLGWILGGLALTVGVALLLAVVVERSISRPVIDLRGGAEAFAAGNLDVTIPTEGQDELSLLAQTFNEMSAELSRAYRDLQQQVAERTFDLERRTRYLQAGGDVSRAAATILEPEALMSEVVELIRERFNLYYVGLFQMDDPGEWAVLRAGTGEAGRAMLSQHHQIRAGEGMIGWAVAHNTARVASQAEADAVRVSNPNLPETRSEAALPLRSRGQVVGALSVQDRAAGAFDEVMLTALQAMADQVAVALDNARLFAEAQAALDAERRAYGDISQRAWQEFLREYRTLRYIGDERGNVRAVSAQETGLDDQATMSVPVKVREGVIGMARFHKPGVGAEWTDEERALLGTLIDQLGVALESARLYEDTQRRAARERVIGTVTSRMRETLELETVLKTAVREMREALGMARVEVRLGAQRESDT